MIQQSDLEGAAEAREDEEILTGLRVGPVATLMAVVRTSAPAQPEVDPMGDLQRGRLVHWGEASIEEAEASLRIPLYDEKSGVNVGVAPGAKGEQIPGQGGSVLMERNVVMHVEPDVMRTAGHSATMSVTTQDLPTLSRRDLARLRIEAQATSLPVIRIDQEQIRTSGAALVGCREHVSPLGQPLGIRKPLVARGRVGFWSGGRHTTKLACVPVPRGTLRCVLLLTSVLERERFGTQGLTQRGERVLALSLPAGDLPGLFQESGAPGSTLRSTLRRLIAGLLDPAFGSRLSLEMLNHQILQRLRHGDSLLQLLRDSLSRALKKFVGNLSKLKAKVDELRCFGILRVLARRNPSTRPGRFF